MSSRMSPIPLVERKAVWMKLSVAIFQGTLLLSFAETISVCAELISKIMPETYIVSMVCTQFADKQNVSVPRRYATVIKKFGYPMHYQHVLILFVQFEVLPLSKFDVYCEFLFCGAKLLHSQKCTAFTSRRCQDSGIEAVGNCGGPLKSLIQCFHSATNARSRERILKE